MKKVLVVFIVGVVLFGCFSAQRAEAQSANIAQKIIGTWVDQRGCTWVFNANATLTRQVKLTNTRTGEASKNNFQYKFGVTDTNLILVDSDYGTLDAEEEIFNISISPDGKTLILVGCLRIQTRNGNITSSTAGFWLEKK